MVRKILCSLILASFFCASSSGQQFEWFDVSAFDLGLVQSSAGQIFHNVVNDIDMLATGSARGEIKVRENDIVSVNDFMESTCFTFEFGEDVHLYARVESLDSQEVVKVASFGDLAYVHQNGAEPTYVVTNGVDPTTANLPVGSGSNSNTIVMMGNGTGFDSDGAARGYIDLGESSSFSWCFTSQSEAKSEALSIGVMAVPEPTAFILIALSGLGIFTVFGRSK